MRRPAPRHIALAAATFAAIAFLLAPTIVVIVQSVSEEAHGTFPPDGVSLRWFRALVDEPRWLEAVMRSALVATVVSTLALAIGTPAVYALVRLVSRGRRLLLAALLAPLVLPGVVLGIAIFLFSARLGIAGTPLPLGLAHLALALPFVVAVLWGSFAAVDWSLEEAAVDLGFGRLAAFFRVTVPQIRLGLLGAGAFAWLASFDQLETSLFLSPPGSPTLPVEMFRHMQQQQDPTVGAIGAGLVLMSAILAMAFGLAWRGRLPNSPGPGSGRGPRLNPAGGTARPLRGPWHRGAPRRR